MSGKFQILRKSKLIFIFSLRLCVSAVHFFLKFCSILFWKDVYLIMFASKNEKGERFCPRLSCYGVGVDTIFFRVKPDFRSDLRTNPIAS